MKKFKFIIYLFLMIITLGVLCSCSAESKFKKNNELMDVQTIEMSYKGYDYLVVCNNADNHFTEMLIFEKSNSSEPIILIYVCSNLEQFDEVYNSCENINDDVYSFKKIDTFHNVIYLYNNSKDLEPLSYAIKFKLGYIGSIWEKFPVL